MSDEPESWVLQASLVAVYDDRLPETEQNRWELFKMDDAHQLGLTYIDLALQLFQASTTDLFERALSHRYTSLNSERRGRSFA